MEMVKTVPSQNHVDVLPPVRRANTGKNDALRVHVIGKMWREVLPGSREQSIPGGKLSTLTLGGEE